MSGARQEVEAIAVRWSRGGKAKGRHSGGVSSEPLQDQQKILHSFHARDSENNFNATCLAFTRELRSQYKCRVVRL